MYECGFVWTVSRDNHICAKWQSYLNIYLVKVSLECDADVRVC